MTPFDMTNEEIVNQLTENTKMTREIHGVLIGRPEYKQPGLIDEITQMKATVQRHDHLIIKVGGGIVVVLFAFEIAMKLI